MVVTMEGCGFCDLAKAPASRDRLRRYYQVKDAPTYIPHTDAQGEAIHDALSRAGVKELGFPLMAVMNKNNIVWYDVGAGML